jgi:hypothetical protein
LNEANGDPTVVLKPTKTSGNQLINQSIVRIKNEKETEKETTVYKKLQLN